MEREKLINKINYKLKQYSKWFNAIKIRKSALLIFIDKPLNRKRNLILLKKLRTYIYYSIINYY